MHFLSLAMALGAALSVSATQIHHRPEDYLVKKLPHTPPSNRTVAPQKVHERRATIERRANGKVNMAYYTNWSIYARAFYPQNIDASKLTHILYGFADCDATTGQVTLTDLNADQLKLYDGDNSSEGGTNLYGNLKQLYLMKQKNRSLKVMLTIGGFTYSQEGHFNFITSASARATFISSAITIMEDNGLDGIDIDFEFPTAGAQAQGYASLLSELRTALNSHASKKGETNPYQITAAVPAGSDNYTKLLVSQMDPSLTFWNLMAYDYSGDWSSAADDQANLYGPTTTGFDTNTAIQWYTANGATASKIALGMPIYGRSFENTGGRGQSYSGVGTGTWDSGVYDYKALPLSGAVVYEDSSRGSSYSYDSSKREWVSYDTPNIIRQKAAYAVSKGLAGGMFWELSADKTGSESLVGASASSLGSLDSTSNHLYYPYSKFDNVKNNMGQGTVLPTTSAQVTSTTTTKTTTQVATTTTTTSAAATTTASTGGGCSGLSAWRSDIAYVGGDVVTYNSHKWTAQWWNQAELPGGASGVWTDNGAC